ncbi:hypothetical protein A2335_03815 [Candidatus Peregrinibacteria bacterium RIFOXYB2_FULL_32_7]|nr:MAG: hypothetical protein A2335_03815 [Candidatus Peregrinibacteria bacterium RIFOXYB2_FULL_32_7]
MDPNSSKNTEDIFANQNSTPEQNNVQNDGQEKVKEENKKSIKKHPFPSLILKLIILIGIFSFAYMQTQLSVNFSIFGVSVAKEIQTLEKELLDNQAQINKINLSVAVDSLNFFALKAEDYLSHLEQINSNFVTKNTKEKLSAKLPEIKNELKVSITTAKEAVTAEKSSGNISEEQAKKSTEEKLTEEKLALASELNASENKDDVRKKIQNLNEILNLLNNDDLIAKIKSFDIESLSEESIKSLLENIYSQQNNKLTTIYNIDKEKLIWSNVMHEIEIVTKGIDPLYGSALSQNIGQIKYNSFQLEKGENEQEDKIIVNGTITTSDSKNFNIASDLIDSFTNSTLFSGAKMRSFNKKFDEENQYIGNFNIELTFQN